MPAERPTGNHFPLSLAQWGCSPPLHPLHHNLWQAPREDMNVERFGQKSKKQIKAKLHFAIPIPHFEPAISGCYQNRIQNT